MRSTKCVNESKRSTDVKNILVLYDGVGEPTSEGVVRFYLGGSQKIMSCYSGSTIRMCLGQRHPENCIGFYPESLV